MTKLWYYAVNGERHGPVSDETLTQRVREGVVTPTTLVWQEGMADWQPYAKVRPWAGGTSNPGSATNERVNVSTVAGESVGFEFTGNWQEYFKIWVVNVLLTIATLGLYAAWAKVRKKRYLYSNTRLFGQAFEYLGDSKKILVGNLIVVGVFFGYSFVGVISPLIQFPLMLLLFAAVPWVIVRAFCFNARNSAWRGLRFNFTGDYAKAAMVYLLWTMTVPLTLGLSYPYVVKLRKAFVMGHHRFGTTPFHFFGQTREIYKIYLTAALFFLPLVVVYLGVTWSGAVGPLGAITMLPLLAVGVACAYVGSQFLRARMFSYGWNCTTLGKHKFHAHMRARDLVGLQLLNAVVTIVTFGLMYPWAAIRLVKFQLASLAVVPQGQVDDFVAAERAAGSALGESASDFFDFDLGFGL